jgi:hypothetical protein
MAIRLVNDHGLPLAKLVRVVEVGEVAARQPLVLVDQRLDDLGVDTLADVALTFECDYVGESRARRNRHRRHEVRAVRIVTDVLMNSMNRTQSLYWLASMPPRS